MFGEVAEKQSVNSCIPLENRGEAEDPEGIGVGSEQPLFGGVGLAYFRDVSFQLSSQVGYGACVAIDYRS